MAEGTRHASLAYLGVGALLGFVCAAVSVVMVMAYAFLAGRDFCNEICPVGTVLGVLSARSAMHIELIPDRFVHKYQGPRGRQYALRALFQLCERLS